MVIAASPRIIALEEARAVDTVLVGSKAANLDRCGAAGLPILPGFVITTEGSRHLGDESFEEELRSAWERLAHDRGALVVRSSSTAEDLSKSSMAGRFRSVLDVRGWDRFREAVDAVVASALEVGDADGGTRPMAVLVQRQLDLTVGGVLFGVDPITGDRDHLVVEVVPSRVDDLVGGDVTAAHYVLTRSGRVVERARADAAPPLRRSLRRRLARLARDTAATLGSAQDVEWAVGRDGRLWLLQSRPVTAVADRRGPARVFGPGPVAETFPGPLRRLERDLWIDPLRDGIGRALRASGVVSERALDASPLLVTIGGRVAIDLELTGIATGTETFRRRYGPRQIVRRLAASWRIGRLRVAFPRLARSVVDDVDADLAAIPPLDSLDARVLVDLIERGRRELATVHSYEVLAGMLLPRDNDGLPASLLALDALHIGRDRGWSDDEIIARSPVVLAMTAPSLLSRDLPASVPAPVHEPSGIEALDEREALRLRARWIQELLALAVRSLARRLVSDRLLDRAELVRELHLEELFAAVDGIVPIDLEARARGIDGPPLPARFRLTPAGGVLPVEGIGEELAGMPASAGRAVGIARERVAPGSARDGSILVVGHLEPAFAPLLPSIDGLVSETGSVLSHLAILARELGVPAVVGVPDARRRFPPGTRLVVDGDSGDVHEVMADTEPDSVEVGS
jgi:phosphohistidine swiveling domain-containing protein